MKRTHRIPLALLLAICLILAYVPAFAENSDDPGFGTPDSGPPILHSISIDKTEVTAPGTITITANVTDDISGVSHIEAYFKNYQNNRSFVTAFTPEEFISENTYKTNLDVTQYEPTGLFELFYVQCYDVADNVVYYYSANEPNLSESEKLLPNEISFFVHNTDESGNNHNFGITNPNLAGEIDNLPEGVTANIAFGNASKLPAAVFEAIKEKDKTIALSGNGIQWIFNGQDISSSKEIDLSVNISYFRDDELTDDSDIYLLRFADNDQLPGKAKIRIKADAAMKQALGQSNVYVYYYDEQNQKLENIASNITVTSDSYFEFEITHCSDYVMTKGPAKNPSGSTDPDPNPSPNPSYSSGSGSGGSGGGGRSSSGSSKSSAPLLKPRQAINTLLGKTGLVSGTASTPAYGTVDLDRSANDLTMAYIASLNLPREQMAAYYVEHYAELYKQFRGELQSALSP